MARRAALIVVDMLVDFFDGASQLSAQRPRLVNAINVLITGFRDAGQSVIWVRQEFKSDLTDAFLDMRRRGVAITIAETEGCQILPELQQAPADHVIVKKRYSAFFRTPLEDLLTALDPSTLVIAGINTHACVRMTAIDAYQRDFDVVVASDCVSSYDAAHHDMTMSYLDGRIARVLSNSEIIRDLALFKSLT